MVILIIIILLLLFHNLTGVSFGPAFQGGAQRVIFDSDHEDSS